MKRSAILLAAIAVALFPVAPATAAGTVTDGLIVVDAFDSAGADQIYTLQPDGSELRQLTHAPAGSFAEDPRFSPNGRLIAYDRTSPRNHNDAAIAVMKADGTGKRLVYNSAHTFDSQPSFYPSGHSLIFNRCRSGGSEGCSLYSIKLDGTHLHKITSAGTGVFDYAASVSHDGRHIVFNRNGYRGYTQRVWEIDSNGRHGHPITRPALLAKYPSFSADDSKVVFTSDCCKPGGDVYTVAPNGRHTHRLTRTRYPDSVFFATEAPTGTRIVLTSNRAHPDGTANDLFVANANGSHLRRIPVTLNQPFALSWAPAT